MKKNTPNTHRFGILCEFIAIFLPLIYLLLPCWTIKEDDHQLSMAFLLTQVLIALITWCVLLFVLYRKKKDSFEEGNTHFSLLTLCAVPAMEYVVIGTSLAVQSGLENLGRALPDIVCGLIFLILGNFLGRISPNQIIGLRTPWTLANRENWRRSSRITGWIWVLGGLLLWLMVLLRRNMWISFFIIVAVALSPLLVSWLIYRRQKEEGVWVNDLHLDNETLSGPAKWTIGIGMFLFILVIAGVVVFGGRYSIQIEDDNLKISSLLCGKHTIEAEEIESVQIMPAEDPGSRTSGYNANGIDLGHYYNNRYGNYLRYTSSSSKVIEIVEKDGQVYVLSLKNEEQTENLYEKIREWLSAHTPG